MNDKPGNIFTRPAVNFFLGTFTGLFIGFMMRGNIHQHEENKKELSRLYINKQLIEQRLAHTERVMFDLCENNN